MAFNSEQMIVPLTYALTKASFLPLSTFEPSDIKDSESDNLHTNGLQHQTPCIALY